jgi:peptidoglycan/LPS O-acetylase OafA/YrhL
MLDAWLQNRVTLLAVLQQCSPTPVWFASALHSGTCDYAGGLGYALYAVHTFLMCAVMKNQTELVIYEACTTETFLKVLAGGGMAVNCHMHLGQKTD